ncbi:MAG: hypothetical protein KBC96_06600 [Armatimonadetes bacterium]|nr:hypothetical protein [Armatimonadota bacterium]
MKENIVQDALLKAEIREAQQFENMTVLPLFSDIEQGPAYLTLGEAMEKQFLTVKEIDEGGSVPRLCAVNSGDVPVLLLDGEEMIGAKQNRVVNTTILLDAKSETVIPVSCTEQGRWHYTSERFDESAHLLSRRTRESKLSSVSRSLHAGASFASNQSEIWSEIADMHTAAGVDSPTGAMRDVYERRSADISQYLDAFPCAPGQRGVLVFVNGRVSGLDFLSSEAAYPKLHSKLVKSYAMDALLRNRGPSMPDLGAAKTFLEAAAASSGSVFDSVGMGKDHRYEGPSVVGSALVCEESVVHMAFFKVETRGNGPDIASSRARMRFRREHI